MSARLEIAPIYLSIRSGRQRRIHITATLVACLCLSATPRVDAWSLADVREDWWGFLAGVGTGFFIHETAHVLLADLNGYRVDNDGLALIYPDANMSDRDRLRIASAGLQAQWIATEFAFASNEDESRPGNFAAGIVVSQLLVSAAYLTVLKDHRQGDIYGMHDATAWSRDQLAVTMAINSLFDGWRLSGRRVPTWVPHMSRASTGLMLGAIWTF